jgi:hypothetical protein
MGIHLATGFFISLASQSNDYLGRYPREMCEVTPFPLQSACQVPSNRIPQTGLFISLGVLFSGISVGSNTFGNEIVVYWRDVSGGMPTVPYFFAKVLVDLPRIVFSGFMFSLSLIFLWPYRGEWLEICIIVVALYFSAFCMGKYLIHSSVFSRRDA